MDFPLFWVSHRQRVCIIFRAQGIQTLELSFIYLGLVCLGFPSTTLAGKRGEIGDPLLDLKTPTLFVIGDRATDACSDDIEVSHKILKMYEINYQ